MTTSRRHGVHRVAPFVMALFFSVWPFRGPAHDNPVDTDAARHAMNGAFLHDLVREGKLTHAAEYAKSYYSRLPALSLPYHPPLFPAFESILYLGFGVNWLAARLAVAIATAACVFLFYKLAFAAHASHAFAAFTTLTFFSLESSQRVASDVMLEFPALAFTLGALLCLRGLDSGFPLRRGLAFAFLAAGAVWTKQNTVFLILVPFAYAVLERRWRLLAGKTIWIASAVLALLAASLAVTAMLAGFAGNRRWPRSGILEGAGHNLVYYSAAIRTELGLVPALFIAASLAALAFRRPGATGGSANGIYLAWACSALGILVFLPPYDARYLFFAYPALVAIGYVGLFALSRKFLPERRAWYPPAAAAALSLVIHLNTPPVFLQGPSEAARTVVTGPARRVLYCGRANGSFIFSVRSLDPRLSTVVIRGDKLLPATFRPAEFEEFAHRYGITYVVLERRRIKKPWDALFESPSRSMKLIREIPLVSSEQVLNGRLRVFEFTNPSASPESALKLSTISGSHLEVEF